MDAWEAGKDFFVKTGRFGFYLIDTGRPDGRTDNSLFVDEADGRFFIRQARNASKNRKKGGHLIRRIAASCHVQPDLCTHEMTCDIFISPPPFFLPSFLPSREALSVLKALPRSPFDCQLTGRMDLSLFFSSVCHPPTERQNRSH